METWTQRKTNFPSTYNHAYVLYKDSVYIHQADKLFVLDLNTLNWQEIKVTEQPSYRECHSAVINTITGKSMIIFGGCRMSHVLQYNDVYEFQFENWEWKLWNCSGDLPGARHGHAAIVRNHCMIVFGGFKLNNDLFELNLKTKKWRKMEYSGDVCSARGGHSAVLCEDYMFVFGGYDGKQWVNDLFRFNFVTNLWKKIETTECPSPRAHSSCVVYDHFMYVFGGSSRYEGCFNDLWEFDCRHNKWRKVFGGSMLPSFPLCRDSHAAVVKGNSMFLIGGFVPEAGYEGHFVHEFHFSSRPMPVITQLIEQQYCDLNFEFG